MNTGTQTASAEWKRHWPLVVAATAGMSLFAVATATFGVMVVPIEQDTGWSRTEIAIAPSLISFMVICFATLYGTAIDRFGSRRIALLGIAGLGGALALASQIGTQVWQWWGVWALIGLASAMAPAVFMASINSTLSAGRGLAMAVVLSGSGISSSIGPIIANTLVEQYSWREAYLYMAVAWFAVTFTLALLFLRSANSPQPATQSDPGKTATGQPQPGLTAREGFRSAVFYKLLAATVIANFAGIALMLNVIPMLQATGLSAATAAGVASFIGIATIAGRVVSGGLIDRFDAGRIALFAAVLMGVLPAMLLLLPGVVPAAILGVVTYGLMGGAMMPCVAYLAGRHLGQRAFGTLYATIMAAMSIAIGLGPVIANVVFDAVQSYDPVLIGSIPLFLVGALIFATLGAYPDFEKKAEG